MKHRVLTTGLPLPGSSLQILWPKRKKPRISSQSHVHRVRMWVITVASTKHTHSSLLRAVSVPRMRKCYEWNAHTPGPTDAHGESYTPVWRSWTQGLREVARTQLHHSLLPLGLSRCTWGQGSDWKFPWDQQGRAIRSWLAWGSGCCWDGWCGQADNPTWLVDMTGQRRWLARSGAVSWVEEVVHMVGRLITYKKLEKFILRKVRARFLRAGWGSN